MLFISMAGFPAAAATAVFQLFVAWLGGFFNVMDTTGWAMLVLPSIFAFIGANFGWRMRLRWAKEDAEAFVPPPPPEGWSPRRKRRPSRNDRPLDKA
jgi:hypothetical protein